MGMVSKECHYSNHVMVGPSKGQALWPLVVDGGGDGPSLSSSIDEVDGCGPLHLERRLAAM
jgi:hypothetical protein